MSRSKVTSRDSEITLRASVTGLESSNRARRWSSAASREPNRAANSSSGATASWPSVAIPQLRSRSTVLGPIPGTRLHPASAKRRHAASRLKTTKPWLIRDLGRFSPGGQFRRAARHADEVLFDEIRRRRSDPEL